MIALSVTGLVRTLLILIGAFVLLRFIGQVLRARRDMEAEKERQEQERRFELERKEKQRNLGKTSILDKPNSNSTIQDVDFEEID